MGQRQSQPILMGEAAKKQGIYGICGDLYCPNCNQKFDFIFIEFGKPFPDFPLRWRENIIREMNEDVMLCPRCGFRDLELM